MKSDGVVIVGAGQAGFQVASSLRMEGYEEPIALIGDEPNLPYQRPPLSKGFMAGKQDIEGTVLRPLAFYQSHRIDLVTGTKVNEIDRLGRSVSLATGRRLPYESLVLAVGARNRKLSVKGCELDGVCYLRTDIEAVEIQQRLEQASNLVVIGGGFIGLELAAAARSLGKSVRVLEVQSRLMPRVVSPILSDFYRDLHTSHGVEIALGGALSEIVGHQGKVCAVVLSDGSVCQADLVLVGIGVVPNIELAREAGLTVSNGIIVDERLQTEDHSIYAIGDCADHPNPLRRCARPPRIRAECCRPGQMYRGGHRRPSRKLPCRSLVLDGAIRYQASDGRAVGSLRTSGHPRHTRKPQIFSVLFQGRKISRRRLSQSSR